MADYDHAFYYKTHECVRHFMLYDFHAKAVYWIVISGWQKHFERFNGAGLHFL